MMFGLSGRDDGAANRQAAMDVLGACIMIADERLNITYVNKSVLALMQEAEADLRKALPRFGVATLMGSNIDVFYNDASDLRTVLPALDRPHNTTIVAGKRTFDLLVTPLMSHGRRTGFVMEWSDATARLLNIDYAGQVTAISRSLAVIEFATDATILNANKNFLDALGYTLDEVRGKPHSMFVEPAQRSTREYAEFWERLRRGEYQAAQYKRIGKNGREVWIEATYNPILDSSGRVSKVVKFATDITAQMQLLSNFKLLIDTNFGEIDGAIGLSTTEARSASEAASATFNNVQAMATSADELAASIGEISQSMAKSRDATESAFQQAVAVGRSTDTLAGAAQAMNGIVGLIRNVASQINPLALNATIEAARAGDAGKGFAVVASEVKNLAIQAAKATEQISSEIDGIQTTSSEVAGALGAIRDAVTTVRESVTLTAAAVEEQSAVTRGMSANMRSASSAVSTVSANITEISSAVLQAAQAVSKTRQAAEVLVR